MQLLNGSRNNNHANYIILSTVQSAISALLFYISRLQEMCGTVVGTQSLNHVIHRLLNVIISGVAKVEEPLHQGHALRT